MSLRLDDKTALEALRWLAVSLVLLAMLAGYRMVVASLWVDELFSVATAGQPAGEMLSLLRGYQPGFFDHPPLYFLVLRSVMLWSEQPWVLRMPSVLSIAGTLTILALMLRSNTPSWGLRFAAVTFASLNTELLRQATNIRMYALLALISAGALWALEGLVQGGKPRERWLAFAGLALTLCCGCYTSTFFLLILPGLGFLSAAWIVRQETRRSGWMLLGALGTATILYVPWMPTLWRMLHTANDPGAFLAGDKSGSLPALFVDLVGGLAAIPMILIGWGWILFSNRNGRGRWIGYLVAFLLLPLALLLVLLPETRSIGGRYLMPGVVITLFGSARGAADLWNSCGEKRIVRWFLACALGLAVAGGVVDAAPRLLNPTRAWWYAAEVIEREVRPGETVMTGAFLSGEGLTFHMKAPEKIPFLHYQTKLDPFYIAARSPQVVWYVNAGPLPDAFGAIIDRYFPYRYVAGYDEEVGTPLVVYSKRTFLTRDSHPAVYHEPIPLPYE